MTDEEALQEINDQIWWIEGRLHSATSLVWSDDDDLSPEHPMPSINYSSLRRRLDALKHVKAILVNRIKGEFLGPDEARP